MKHVLFLGLLIIVYGCSVSTEENQVNNGKDKFVISTWTGGGNTFNEQEWDTRLKDYLELGISEILVHGSPQMLNQLIPLANQYDIKVHGWMWTLNRPSDSIAREHPEWYSVNRLGQNSLEYNAYVGYYQWLSPFHPEAREHIKGIVKDLCNVKGLASVHLDYVRYVDVILGAPLQEKYGIIQNRELPEYDFGYHPIAREGFIDLFGKDPIEMEHPELSTEWKQYRLNAVTNLVNELVEIAHMNGTKMTAAVFPFPEMSRQTVRQAWNNWNLDAAYPMLYHNFYNENINWIGFSTMQGVMDVNFPIHSGLFVSALKDSGDFRQAILLAKENGAAGISLFTANSLTDEQKKVLKDLKKEFKLSK
jgi:uncharacterized lipoprotein YddW (UPF0748 family)